MKPGPTTLAEARQWGAALEAENGQLRERLGALEHQLEWFKRQLFGEKSERRLVEVPPEQMSLGEGFERPDSPAPTRPVPAHRRRIPQPCAEQDSPLFFDEQVPVEVIEVPNPALQGLAEGDYEIIGEKASYRLAQRPGSHVVLKYVRRVIKRRDDQRLYCAAAPDGVFGNGRADVSFVAGLLIDKFLYHQPLYRLHQRLKDQGIRVSRQWLTELAHGAGALLEPIYEAQFQSVRESRVKAMDDDCMDAGGRATQEQLPKRPSRPGARARASSTPATSGRSMGKERRSSFPSSQPAPRAACTRPWARVRQMARC